MTAWRNNHAPIHGVFHNTSVAVKIYRTIILPIVLYVCETWSLTIREERRLRVLEYMVLRRLFGPRRDEVTGECRKRHNEELNDLYSSPNNVQVTKSRRMGWEGHVARQEEGRGVYRVLVGKPDGRRPLGRSRCRWECNIKMGLQKVGCWWVYGLDWTGSGYGQVAGTCECGNEPSGFIKFWELLTSFKPISFPIRTLFLGVSR